MTVVRALTKFPDGAYSIRTMEGVKNSNRAFPETIVELFAFFEQETVSKGTINNSNRVKPVYWNLKIE